jgi:hypothetical protein
MTSIREQILQATEARVRAAIAPVPLHRHPTVPVDREGSPAVVLIAEGDAISSYANGRVDRALTVRCVALARGANAFDTTDQLIVAVHSALMTEANLNALVIAVREIDCDWDSEDIDAGVVAIPARYEIRYRTHAHDLTLAG